MTWSGPYANAPPSAHETACRSNACAIRRPASKESSGVSCVALPGRAQAAERDDAAVGQRIAILKHPKTDPGGLRADGRHPCRHRRSRASAARASGCGMLTPPARPRCESSTAHRAAAPCDATIAHRVARCAMRPGPGGGNVDPTQIGATNALFGESLPNAPISDIHNPFPLLERVLCPRLAVTMPGIPRVERRRS